jgi:hypothetical protein
LVREIRVYVTFIGVMLVIVVIANVHLGRFGGFQR